MQKQEETDQVQEVTRVYKFCSNSANSHSSSQQVEAVNAARLPLCSLAAQMLNSTRNFGAFLKASSHSENVIQL